MFERRLWPRSAQCKSLASFKYSSIFDNGGQVCRPASQINRLDSRCVGALGKEEWFPNTPGGVGAASPRAGLHFVVMMRILPFVTNMSVAVSVVIVVLEKPCADDIDD